MDCVLAAILTYWTRWVWPILQFVIGLGLVIFVHELGHFLAAKWAGIRVDRFSLGFGRKLWGFRRGETEYRIGILPLGGYVQMLGQDDFKPPTKEQLDPRSWQAARPSRKLVVLSAGVAMNVVFAAVVFVIVYLVGIRFAAPVVGSTQAGFPAATVVLPQEVARAMGRGKAVGLEPWDRVAAINGRRVRRFDQLAMAAILSDTDEVFRLRVVRELEAGPIEFEVTLKPKKDESRAFGDHFIFGINPALSRSVQPGDTGYAGGERFRDGDEVIEVAGEPVADFRAIMPVLRAHAGEPVEFVVRRSGRRMPVKVQPLAVRGRSRPDGKELLEMLGMAARVRVQAVGKGTPAAEAGLTDGDLIIDYAGLGAPGRAELMGLSERFVGQETSIQVLRNGEVLDLRVTPAREDKDSPALIGIITAPEQEVPFVADVRGDSPAAEAGVPEEAVLTGVNDTPVSTWAEVYAALRSAAGKEATLTYRLGAEQGRARIGVLTKEMFDAEAYALSTPAIEAFLVLKTPPIRGNPLEALAWSAEDTWTWMGSVYKTLRSIFKERASTKALSGPVGIGAIAIIKGREGVIDLAYFMAMLSAVVAVFNFLPLPVLDGGHVVLVLIEKVRGRPLPPKLLAGIQIGGLVLILGIFLAITFQDILRFIIS